MEELVDLIATDASPSDVTDSIKGALMAKAAERIDAYRPDVAATVFGGEAPEEGAYEDEVVDELDYEDEQEYEDEQPTEEDYE